jgi:hypothetical protein
MELVVLVMATILCALLVHRSALKRMHRSQRVAPERDPIWMLESLLAIVGASFLASIAATALVWIGCYTFNSFSDPFAAIALVVGPCYAMPVAILVGVIAHVLWRKYRTPGRCTGCGYDLTGNISGICPECGLPVDQ